MRNGIKLAAAGLVTAGTLAAGGIMGLPVAQAGTAVNWTQRTCQAEQSYARHATTANLDAMMADSFHVAWKYVGEDAAGLYRDVRSGDTSYVAKDKAYFSKDC